MSSITLIILEIFSEATLISVMAAIISFIWWSPAIASSLMLCTERFASFASSALCLVRSAISAIDAVTCSIALACCVEPCAKDWLASDTCSAPVVSCTADSRISESIWLFSTTRSLKAFPRASSLPLTSTSKSRSPDDTLTATSAWYLTLSIIVWKSSSNSPNSSLRSFFNLISTFPCAICTAASRSLFKESRISLKIPNANVMVIAIAATVKTITTISAFCR